MAGIKTQNKQQKKSKRFSLSRLRVTSPSRWPILVDSNTTTALPEPALAICRRGSTGTDGLEGRAAAAVSQLRVDGHRVPPEGLLRLEDGHGLALRRPQKG